MKAINYLVAICMFLFVSSVVIGQVDNDTLYYKYPVNDKIDKATALTDEMKHLLVDFVVLASDTDTINMFGATWYWFYLENSAPAVDFISSDGMMELSVYGPYPADYLDASQKIMQGVYTPLYSFKANEEEDPPLKFTIPSLQDPGLYLVKAITYLKKSDLQVKPESTLSESTNFQQVTNAPRTECIGCLDGKMPEPGTYIISAWVRVENPPAGTTSYVGPEIIVTSSAGATVISPSNSILENYIIDEWQLIEGTFNMPVGNAVFSIQLTSTGPTCYFDDVRFFPYNGSMKTYVYDPVNLRLTAELDERHYATLYEYDEEGKLKRIKKETERGVQTIQESINSSVKVKE